MCHRAVKVLREISQLPKNRLSPEPSASMLGACGHGAHVEKTGGTWFKRIQHEAPRAPPGQNLAEATFASAPAFV